LSCDENSENRIFFFIFRRILLNIPEMQFDFNDAINAFVCRATSLTSRKPMNAFNVHVNHLCGSAINSFLINYIALTFRNELR
jgi:hypothetical protein